MGHGEQKAGRTPRKTPALVVGFIFGTPWAGLLILMGCTSNTVDVARRHERLGDIHRAATLYLAAAKRDPANLAAWDGAVRTRCTLGTDVGRCLGVLDLELDLLGNVVRHRDALANVLEARARARLTQGLVKSALEDLARAARAAPNRATLYTARAKAHTMLGHNAEALEALLLARKLDPHNQEANLLFREIPTQAPARDDDPSDQTFGGGGAARASPQ